MMRTAVSLLSPRARGGPLRPRRPPRKATRQPRAQARRSSVAGDIVRIGDLIENAGARRQHADLPRARSRPDRRGAGARGARRGAALRPDRGRRARHRAKSSVTHASRTIAADDIEARIVRRADRALQSRQGRKPEDHVRPRRAADRARRTANGEPTLARMSYEPISRPLRRDVRACRGNARAQWRYTGTAVETSRPPSLTRAARHAAT